MIWFVHLHYICISHWKKLSTGFSFNLFNHRRDTLHTFIMFSSILILITLIKELVISFLLLCCTVQFLCILYGVSSSCVTVECICAVALALLLVPSALLESEETE